MLPIDLAPGRLDAEHYFALVARGEILPDDRVELLEGVVVSSAPLSPPHANAIARIGRLLVTLVDDRGVVRIRSPFHAGGRSVPEPDLTVVPAPLERWEHTHPDEALFVIEVADSSLPTDRLTKAAIYAMAGVPQYLVVNLRNDRIECFAQPIAGTSRWKIARAALRGDHIPLVAFPGLSLAVDDLLPRR